MSRACPPPCPPAPVCPEATVAAPAALDPWTILQRNAVIPRVADDAAGPPAPLAHLVGDAAWTIEPRDDGRGVAALRTRGRRFDAYLSPGLRSLHAHVEVDRRRERPCAPCRAAAARVLIEATGRARRVRASITTIDDSIVSVRLEVVSAGGADLDAALEALTAACHLAVPEAVHLLDDEVLARRCLEHWPPVRLTPSP